jgi:exosortase/archaeosortase family protein
MPTRKAGRKQKSRDLWKAFASRPRECALLKFLVKFNLFAIPLYLILLLDLRSLWLETFTADVVYSVLQSLGLALERTGNFIIVPIANGSWGAFINWDCTGWKSLLALFALVMATDFTYKIKLKGLSLLLPALFIINIARIAFMFYFVYAFGLVFFELVHAVIWSWGLILAILILWVLWIRWNRKKPVKKQL